MLAILPAAALATAPAPTVSSRYKFVSTKQVVEMMEDEGFTLASATVPTHARVRRDPLYGKHMLDFRLPNVAPLADGTVPRALWVNAHDGTGTAKLLMGAFRFVCSNGLVVGSTYSQESVRHIGNAAENLIERIRRLAKNTGPLFAQIAEWDRRELSRDEEIEFAKAAAVLRFGDAQRFDPAELLTVRREEDEGRSLWRVFNRIQEASTKGGLVGYSALGRQLRSRELTSIAQTVDFNADLWRLAEEFA